MTGINPEADFLIHGPEWLYKIHVKWILRAAIFNSILSFSTQEVLGNKR